MLTIRLFFRNSVGENPAIDWDLPAPHGPESRTRLNYEYKKTEG